MIILQYAALITGCAFLIVFIVTKILAARSDNIPEKYFNTNETDPLLDQDQHAKSRLNKIVGISILVCVLLVGLFKILGLLIQKQERSIDKLVSEIQFNCQPEQLTIINKSSQRLKIELSDLQAVNYQSISSFFSLESDTGRVNENKYSVLGGRPYAIKISPENFTTTLAPSQQDRLQMKFPLKSDCNAFGWNLGSEVWVPCDALIFEFILSSAENNEILMTANMYCRLGASIPSIESLPNEK